MLQYRMKALHSLLFFALALLLSTLFPPLSSAVPGVPYPVTEVHDGDTVSIKLESVIGIPVKVEKIRLIGMDAPELGQEPWGRRAKRHLKKLIGESGWIVRLEGDVQERDKFGRLLGYLWTKQGRLINERMIEDGFAVLFTAPPNVRYVDRLTDAQQKAQREAKGIWGKGGLKKSPQQWRQENPRD